jgi:hypothetical protein
MIIDNYQLFTGTSNGAVGGITASANTDLPTTGTQAASNIIDYGILSGIPSGGAAPNSANRDMGIGDDPALKVVCIVTTALTGGTSLQCQLQGAPDNASGVGGTYTTLWTGPVILEANLVAGAQVANVDFPREIPLIGPVRYVKMNFISAGTHSAGAVEAYIGLDEFRQIIGPAAGSPLSGYPAGVNVAN